MELIEQGKIIVFKNLIRFMTDNNASHTHSSSENRLMLLKFMRPFFVFGIIPMFGVFGYLYVASQDHVPQNQSDSMSRILQTGLSISILIIALSRVHILLSYFEKLSDYTYGHPPNYYQTCQRLDLLSSLVYYGAKSMVLIYIIFQFVNNSYCPNGHDSGYVCGAAWPLWYPIGTKNEFLKMFLRCCAGFVELIYYPLFAVFPVVVIGSAQLIVLRIRHLRSMIIRIANSLQTEFMQDELLICMRYHSSVVELVTSMNAATGYALLPLYLIVPILMAIFGSQIVLAEGVLHIFTYMVMNLLPWNGAVAIICFIGQYLQTESSYLKYNVYNLPWYAMNPKSRKNFLLFLGRVDQPLNFEVRPLADLNNVLLLQIMKTFYSFLTFLIRRTHKV